MEEKNKNILSDAIQKLPQYEPEDTLWIGIEAELEILELENPLQDAIHELPSYVPKDSVWDHIDQELESDVKGNVRKLWVKRIASVAAVIVLVITANSIFFSNSNNETVSISYSEEQVETTIFEKDWDQDEDAFEIVMEFCKSQNIVCELPEFKILKSELEELNTAREELRTALDFYGTDPELIVQLTSIEHERSGILKQMIAKI